MAMVHVQQSSSHIFLQYELLFIAFNSRKRKEKKSGCLASVCLLFFFYAYGFKIRLAELNV